MKGRLSRWEDQVVGKVKRKEKLGGREGFDKGKVVGGRKGCDEGKLG